VRSRKTNGAHIVFNTVGRQHYELRFRLIFIGVLEHGSEKHRKMTVDHLLDGLLEFATNEQGAKSVTKALKEGGIETLDKVVRRMCEPAKGYNIPRTHSFRCFLTDPAFQCSSRNDC